MATAHRTAPRPNARTDQQPGPLDWVGLLFALGVQAESEWSLAVALGWHPIVAIGIPGALGTYAIRALRTRREVLLCVTAMVATISASRLLHAGMIPLTPWLVIAVSAIPALVMWRLHKIGGKLARTEAVTVDVTEDDAAERRRIYGPSATPRIVITPDAAMTPPRPVTPPVTLRQFPVMPRIGGQPARVDEGDDIPNFPDGTPEAVVTRQYLDLRREPQLKEIQKALGAAGLPDSHGKAVNVRQAVRNASRTLAAYPRHPALAAAN